MGRSWWKRTKAETDASLRAQEDLYLLLDKNHEQYFGNHPCWRELQALDHKLIPKGIFTEAFKPCGARDLRTGQNCDENFAKDSTTLVVQLKDGRAAMQGARILNRIFDGTGTKFIPEVLYKGGNEIFQIRSNLDKQHWDKLTVFCHYRFAREIRDAKEGQAIAQQCQQVITDYTKGTIDSDWMTLEGVPAFITLMGTHGVLRPKERHHSASNKHAKQVEFDKPHPRGTPLLFDGVKVHVELKGKAAEKGVVFTPYTYGYDADRAALENAMDGKSYLELLTEAAGGNPFDPEVNMGRRGTTLFWLAMTIYGAVKGEWWPPAVAVATTATGVAIIYVNQKLKQARIMKSLRDKNGEKCLVIEAPSLEKGKVQDGNTVIDLEKLFGKHPEAGAKEETRSLDLPRIAREQAMPEEAYIPSALVKDIEKFAKIAEKGDALTK